MARQATPRHARGKKMHVEPFARHAQRRRTRHAWMKDAELAGSGPASQLRGLVEQLV